jgi:hypothetical protein
MELGEIRSTVRVKQGKQQIMRLFTPIQREMIIKEVESNRGKQRIEDVLKTLNISPVVYYTWLKNSKKIKKVVIPKIKNVIQYKVIETYSVTDLNRQVDEMIGNGWKPVGSHYVVVKHVQNRFAGTQHKDSVSSMEYSQTMIKE